MTMRSALPSPLTVREEPGRTVVDFPGEVDARNVSMVRDGLSRLLEDGNGPLVLDLTATVYCDCACMNAILWAHRRALSLHTDLTVVMPETGAVNRVATLTRLHVEVPVKTRAAGS